ncbi:MAG: hypothetical protein JNM91_11790 [Flavobacteriales bacterium]|nr:hypothetical protein [Flavobacteriales bacterium]
MYKSLDQFRAEKEAARRDRDLYTNALATRWEVLQNPRTRGILLRDAVSDALMSWKPYQRVHDLLHGRVSGEMVSSVGMAAAGLHRSWTKRLIYTGLSLLAGKAMGRNGVPEGTSTLSALAKGIGSVVRRMRERRERRRAEQA